MKMVSARAQHARLPIGIAVGSVVHLRDVSLVTTSTEAPFRHSTPARCMPQDVLDIFFATRNLPPYAVDLSQ